MTWNEKTQIQILMKLLSRVSKAATPALAFVLTACYELVSAHMLLNEWLRLNDITLFWINTNKTYFWIWLQRQPAWIVHPEVTSIVVFLSTGSWKWFTKICLTAGNRFRVRRVHFDISVIRRGACFFINHKYTTSSILINKQKYYIYRETRSNVFLPQILWYGSLSAKCGISYLLIIPSIQQWYIPGLWACFGKGYPAVMVLHFR